VSLVREARVIQLESVTKIYRRDAEDVVALNDVSLKIDTGEFVCVRGPSGCGKSTMLTLIGGLGTPTSGRVVVDGNDWAAMSTAERAKQRATTVGFVFQLFHLLPYLTVLDNVLLAETQASRDNPRGRAEQLLERFNLSHRLTHRPAELSIGERQRVAMARALFNEPRLLLADEPTGNLDPENAKAITSYIEEFHQGGGTVVLVTHDAAAATIAERTIVLRDGSIVESDAATTADT